ncbi:uncharacterized protein NECHADRAFT_66006 [Fusarium vanettenii 77-13-4]|uniref:Uncharacterized protein n=1 Tax=Fusarium vanettenii (strain ATCC MYA-4622 / CBS 123669 / FGSC 9596 / NRRL 45880 / 77-13-4) TaxID=660122 RepID=C7Z5Q4_FUSV7|nr:uncharacterized protein NECHADRAFT_66006 [Fusarium vanettenii 77-13-4]EEU40563.1 hypothetical protein NECHADRAFT_66006 [Fusarium vanettenii 77-13-4]
MSRSVSPATAVTEQQTPPDPTDASSTATAQHESTEDVILTDAHNPSVRIDGDEPQEQAESPSELATPLKKHVLYSIIIIAIAGLFALSAACWLVAFIQTKADGGYIKAIRIGGNVSSTWAKLIDAAVSMLVAPAILAIANWHMFKLARLSAVNEHDKRDSKASLNVLVEVAGTDWGSTSPLKFWTFLQSQKPCIICLGVISILSSLSFSLLSNVTAYEEAGSLQLLQATDLNSRSEGFLGVNISSRARREMRPTIEQLFNVPAYKILASCEPSSLSAVSIGSPDKNDSHVRFNLEEAATSSESGPTQFRADFGIVEELLARQGIEAARKNGSSVRYPLIAFSGTATWIGGFSYTENETVDLTETTGYGSSYDLTFWGVVCSLKRWSGTATANLTGTTLSLTQFKLDGEKTEPQDETPILFLGQKFDTFESGRVGRSPGIGGYLLRAAHRAYQEAGLSTWDIETLVDAFVWYEAAAREAIQGDKSDAKIEGLVSQVEVLEKKPDTYTMTFVPWMLLFGLVALGVACALTVALSLDSLGVPSFRSGRVLDAVRLTADLGRTLGRTAFEETYWMSRQELNECAEGAKFKYEPDKRLDKNRESYVMGVRLRLVSVRQGGER